MDIKFDMLDDQTVAIYLEIPGSQIVELQGYFELYEGIGLVRTLSVKKSLVCVITTLDMLSDCKALLYSLREAGPNISIHGDNSIRWRAVEPPDEETKKLYHGYQNKDGQKKGKEL